jgi:hypothetical protein
MSHRPSPGPSYSSHPPSHRLKIKTLVQGISATADDLKYEQKYKVLKKRVREIEFVSHPIPSLLSSLISPPGQRYPPVQNSPSQKMHPTHETRTSVRPLFPSSNLVFTPSQHPLRTLVQRPPFSRKARYPSPSPPAHPVSTSHRSSVPARTTPPPFGSQRPSVCRIHPHPRQRSCHGRPRRQTRPHSRNGHRPRHLALHTRRLAPSLPRTRLPSTIASALSSPSTFRTPARARYACSTTALSGPARTSAATTTTTLPRTLQLSFLLLAISRTSPPPPRTRLPTGTRFVPARQPAPR